MPPTGRCPIAATRLPRTRTQGSDAGFATSSPLPRRPHCGQRLNASSASPREWLGKRLIGASSCPVEDQFAGLDVHGHRATLVVGCHDVTVATAKGETSVPLLEETI